MAETSHLRVTGSVDKSLDLDFVALAALPDQIDDISPLVPGKSGAGVALRSLLAAAGAHGDFLLLVAGDGFSIAVPRAGVADGIVTYRLGDEPLPAKQGGPVRFYVGRPVACDVGEVDACANVKGLVEIRVTTGRAADTHQH